MSTAGALLLTISLTASVAGPDKLALPDAVIEAGLKKAGCTVPPEEAEVIGIERLSSRLEIVEVTCWRSATNAGSILFAVPEHRPDHAQLLAIESWQDGRILRSYSVSSPGFDPKTRTLSFSHKARGAGDCGTIQEMKWTGWHFRLLNVWNKDHCDGEPFEWDSRDRWQVFPRQVSPRQGVEPVSEGSASGGERAQSSR
ncbi:MAG: DUF1176 domain-containing protein [Xanthobacteraceae bacterium]|nr:DUF1176 domain-containing protein [Xanthobacteraceae bacterium]